jgi:[protein-PII] uridylyltransferase
MSSTAQKSDLSDPMVVENFARFVKTERRLTALYLLTVADIRGTSPVVWNAWKSRLLENLFYATKRMLSTESFNTHKMIALRKEEASHKLNKFGLNKESYQALWDQVGEAYFVRFESDEIAWQSRLLTPHVFTNKPIIRARLSPNGDGIQVMIYTQDQDDLFARICNFFDRMGYNIAQAIIFTTQHGYALNSFIVLDQLSKSVSYNGLLNHIETKLLEKIETTTPLESPLQGRISRQVKHMPYATRVSINGELQSNNHMVEIVAGDRPGLLAKIAFVFLQHDIYLHHAKINTLGSRAEDSFLISAKNNQALTDGQIELLMQNLSEI